MNLGDWLRARPTEYDLAKPETVNARANFFVGGRGIDFPFDEKDPSKKSDKAFWNQVALVWVDPEQLFRPAQNPNITIKDFASASNHFDAIQGSQPINWCTDQFINAVDLINPKKCVIGHDNIKGENGYLFDDFGTYYLRYFNAGSNNDVLSNFFPFPFPFTGLGVTYDP